MNKSKWLKILEVAISIIPISIYLYFNKDMFIKSEAHISTSVILFFGIIALLVVKDLAKNILEWIKTPSPFKFSLIMLVLSYIAVLFGQQFLEMSLITTISFGIAIPLASWSEKAKKEVEEDELLNKLRDSLRGSD